MTAPARVPAVVTGLALLMALLAGLDCAQTWWALGLHPHLFVEANPAAAAIQSTAGLTVMRAVGVAASLTVAALLLIRWPWTSVRWAMWTGGAVVVAGKAAVVALNFVELAQTF